MAKIKNNHLFISQNLSENENVYIVGLIDEFTDNEETLNLIFRKNDKTYIMEFEFENKDIKTRRLTKFHTDIVDLPRQTVSFKNDCSYDLFLLNQNKSLNDFFEDLNLVELEPVSRETFLSSIKYSDLSLEWLDVVSYLKKKGVSPWRTRSIINTYV